MRRNRKDYPRYCEKFTVRWLQCLEAGEGDAAAFRQCKKQTGDGFASVPRMGRMIPENRPAERQISLI